MHPLPSDSSGIKVIIIGCGVAVLGCAIALTQKGHKVVVVFRGSDIECDGEVESMADDATSNLKVVEIWGLGEKLDSLHRIPNILHLGLQAQVPEHDHEHLHTLLQSHAQVLGVEIRTGHIVIAYRQNEVVRKAGVVLDNGERVEGDLVLCVGGETNAQGKELLSEGNDFDTRDYAGRLFDNEEDIAYPWPWTGSDPHWHFDGSGQSQSEKSLNTPSTLHSAKAHDTSQAETRHNGDDISKRRLFNNNNKEDIAYLWTGMCQRPPFVVTYSSPPPPYTKFL